MDGTAPVLPDRGPIDACFLGPYAENDSLLEKLVVEFLRDHVYWRRNFHPEDPPAIPTRAANDAGYRHFETRMRRELHQLSAALKQSVPFHSPRYMGHMVSDLLLPGLAAQMLALPYNPNNVSEDAAPVTVDMEIHVGLQLARMLGYPDDPRQSDCAFGHLTSGGTLANFQALRLALALKAFPVALRAAEVPDLEAAPDDRSAFNLAPSASIALWRRWQQWLADQPPTARTKWQARLRSQRLEQLGLVGFMARHPQLRSPVVLAPASAHYSWSKAMKLLGLGRDQLVPLRQRGMRTDPEALAAQVLDCERQHQPVLAMVAVLGTTEFGSIDPVDAFCDVRDAAARRGLGTYLHVDAAWGGYLATLFRNPDGSLRDRAEVACEFSGFPAPEVHAAFAALPRTDSITVDPHKLGYLPYGIGAFVCRDHDAMGLLVEEADYVFHAAATPDYLARYRSLGRYTLEGSRPGAMAAAAYVTHKVLPLDHGNFGLLPRESIRGAEAFHAAALRFIARIAPWAHACVPFVPDSNLVCIAINPRGGTDIGRASTFVRRLHDELRCDPRQPLQAREFFGSATVLPLDTVDPGDAKRLLRELSLHPPMPDSDAGLVILRHTLMNPYLVDHENGISYIERYFEYLEHRILALAA